LRLPDSLTLQAVKPLRSRRGVDVCMIDQSADVYLEDVKVDKLTTVK
jgi:hypothetical protein